MKNINLDLFSYEDNYLCKINLPDDINGATSANDITTIIILDKSGSMQGSINVLTKTFIPALFTKLDYKEDQIITFITFSDKSEIITYNFKDIVSGININADGCTYLKPALENLKKFLESNNKNKKVRILSISDGELFDQAESVNYSNEVVNAIKNQDLQVNSQAIRFFTSRSQPDTRGLSSCLQFSNVTEPKLIDINAKDFKFDDYEQIFTSDGFENGVIIKSKDDAFKKEPWENYIKEINLRKGENIFWIKKEIGDSLIKGEINNILEFDKLKNGEKLNIVISLKENLNINNYQNIISQKIDFYMKKLKVLKILGSNKSLEEMDTIINYFENFENKLFFKEEAKKLDNSLKSRLISISKKIEKKKISLSNKMAQIRNDEKIAQLNSQQQAEYLRKIDINDKTSKALAKRAFISGLEFDDLAKKEVIEISKHIDELKDIDGDKLNTSFYSTCNTLDGIRTVSELPQNKIFDEITANDIIKLLNIVGVAAYAQVGNYPDPMTYRLEKIYPSTFISISDILTAYEVSNGENLTEISNKNNIISTCVPYFEDERIHEFLLKYAPHLLEFTTSIGMRKIISEVPYTYEYNLLAGYWKMVEILLKDKSEVNIKIFINFIKNYKIVAKSHFEYVIDLVENQKKLPININYIYIANNGITNMTYPLSELILKEKEEIDREFIKKIIRATYQFEVYQYVRKLIRKQDPETTNKFIRDSLIELLNIDIEKNKTKLNPLFESDDDLPIYENYVPNFEISKNKYLKHIFWLDNIVAIPTLLKAALDKENPVEKIKSIPNNLLTDEFMKKELGIEYDLDLFKFNCIIQSFLFKEKSDRYDSNEKKMLISDLYYNNHFDKEIKKYVKRVFQEEFQKDKNAKIKNEINTLKDEIVKKLLDIDNEKDFSNLLNKGIKRGPVELTIINPNSIGYNDLINSLLDIENKNIQKRNEKIFILLTGKNLELENVWNQGNMVRDIDKIKKAKNLFSQELIEKYDETRKKNGLYLYRGGADKRNRQGHSNDLPSYWAYGYQSVSEMSQIEDKTFMDEYYSKHIGCCGLAGKGNLSYTKMRRKGKKEGSIGGGSYHSGNDDK